MPLYVQNGGLGIAAAMVAHWCLSDRIEAFWKKFDIGHGQRPTRLRFESPDAGMPGEVPGRGAKQDRADFRADEIRPLCIPVQSAPRRAKVTVHWKSQDAFDANGKLGSFAHMSICQ
jgi:hypothetical protein